MMNSPNATGQTAIRVLGEDVVGSLQHTPLMDSMRAPALTSPMNFSATSSASQPPRWMPKERRRRDQRGDHASAERLDEAFERPLPPIRLRPLFWIGEWTTRQGANASPTCHIRQRASCMPPHTRPLPAILGSVRPAACKPPHTRALPAIFGSARLACLRTRVQGPAILGSARPAACMQPHTRPLPAILESARPAYHRTRVDDLPY